MKKTKEDVVTIKDISEKLDVSIVSVHRALQGKEGVGADLREKILKTAKEMGYVPNYMAASMKRKKKKIAIVLPIDRAGRSLYFDYIWKGIQDSSEETKAYNLELEEFPVRNEEEQYLRLKSIADAGTNKYAGVLSFSFSKDEKVLMQLQRLITMGIKVLIIDNSLDEPEGIICVSSNECQVGKIAGEFVSLITPDSGTVLISSGRKDSDAHKNKIISFIDFLKVQKPNLKVEVVNGYDSNLGKENGLYKEAVRKIGETEDLAAIFALTSYDNLPFVEALDDSGKGRKVKLVGSDINDETKTLLEDGKIQAVIHQGAYAKGHKGLIVLADFIVKKSIPEPVIYTSIDIVVKSNLNFYNS